MRSVPTDTDAVERLETLVATLQVALELANGVAHDRVLQRLFAAFKAMPAEDRDVIVGVIEREVHARRLSRATEGITGQGARPNPNARLYVRTHGREAQRSDFERDEMALATMRALKVPPLLTIPEVRDEWRAATRQALAESDPAVYSVMEDLLVEALAMVRERRPVASTAPETAV
jgi:hypothetical protein